MIGGFGIIVKVWWINGDVIDLCGSDGLSYEKESSEKIE